MSDYQSINFSHSGNSFLYYTKKYVAARYYKNKVLSLQTSVFGLPSSDFGHRTSDFGLPTSDFRLPTSGFRLLTT